MAKLDELWDPVPRRLIADMRSEKWTAERPAPELVGWLWAFRQIGDGAVPSIRDLCAYAGWGSHRATRLLNEVVQASNTWTGGEVERQAPHNGKKRNTSATPPQHLRNTSATPPQHLEAGTTGDTEEPRNTSATPPQHLRNTSATPPQRRARNSFRQQRDTTGHPQETEDRDLTGSPPPAEPSGSPSDGSIRPALSPTSEQAAQKLPTAEVKNEGSPSVVSEMETPAEPEDLDAWRADHTTAYYPLSAVLDEFEPFDSIEHFEDAHHDGIPEQPSNPRQIESPATHRAPEAPPQGSRPSPTRSQGNGEGATGPAQGALWGSEASGAPLPPPPPPEPARAPPRPRKAPPEPPPLDHPDDPAPLLLGAKVSVDHLTEDLLTVYRSWWHRQASPATCRLTRERFGLIRQALTVCTVEQLVHLVRYAYEAADLGNWHRAWRGESGQSLPELAMLLRGDKFEGNVWRAAQWGVERIEGAPPADPLPANVHPFPMPPPPSPFPHRGGGRDFAAMTATLARIARDDLNERGAHHGQ